MPDPAHLTSHGIDLGDAYVVVDRDATGQVRALQLGTAVALLELRVAGDLEHGARMLLDLSAAARIVAYDLADRTGVHLPG